jgi:hypothetical protein
MLFLLHIQQFIRRKSELGKYEHSNSKKYGLFRWAPKPKGDFTEKGSNEIDKISLNC